MNRVVHFEIAADDMDRAKKFYEMVFGWKIEDWKGGQFEYGLITTGDVKEPGSINGGLMRRHTKMAEGGENAFGLMQSV